MASFPFRTPSAPTPPVSAVRSVEYVRHRPEETLLFQLLEEHWPAFVREASESDRPLPRYLLDEVDSYLRCGLLEHGFARLLCEGCGHDLLVAFSCKGRGFCPSCGGRRMTQTAAHRVDRVFAEVPVRPWVLSAPFELRFLLARHPAVLTALDRIFVDEIGRFYRRRSEAEGRAGARTGAVTFVQRFGGSLNLHVHFHVVVPDGVFTREPGQRAVFHPTTAPRPDELAVVVSRVAQRMTRWLVQQGHASRPEASGSEEGESGEADGWLQLSLAGGQFVRLVTDDEDEDDDGAFGPRRRDPMVAESQGFSLHAGVRVAASDREARERLFRYGARPALCLERLSVLPDGRVAYRLKKRGRRGATHRVMTPQELMARLAALVPPPWHPLTRFHGVLAPHHAWRSSVVPLKTTAPKRCAAPPKRQLELGLDDAGGEPPRRPRRMKQGEDPGNRIDWAELLARTFDLDVLACPRCPGRLQGVEVISDLQRAVEWLSRRGRTEKLPPPQKRATAPPEQLRLPFPRSPSPRR